MERVLFWIVHIVLTPADLFLKFLSHNYRLFKWFIIHTPGSVFSFWGRINLWRAFLHAKLRVPAYSDYVNSADTTTFRSFRFASIPEMDKETYIRKYTPTARSKDGIIPFRNTVIDESSGSSGTPYNWVRSLEERQVSHQLVSHFARYCINPTDIFAINAFSMGAWATGLNMGLALQNTGLVKNVGPDIDKIFITLETWGAEYNYLICGYPPFLNLLLDSASERDFPIENYTLYGLVGGEGMSEGLRDYLEKHFRKVYSGYGATDLEIVIAGETPLSVEIRRAARDNPALRKALFGDDSRLPMVFQYNPVTHYIDVNEDDELVFTITRLNVLSPRIRYNIHDEGGVMDLNSMRRKCAEHGFDFAEKVTSRDIPHLPFLLVYGRKDYTVSVMGANIYPEDIEQSLYTDEDLSSCTRSYCLGLSEVGVNVRPAFSFEVTCAITSALEEKFEQRIVKCLLELNSDFHEAWQEYPEELKPLISLYSPGQGPFAEDSGRIKQVRMV